MGAGVNGNGDWLSAMLKTAAPTIIASLVGFGVAWGVASGKQAAQADRITALERIVDKRDADHDAIVKMSGDHETLQRLVSDHGALEKTVSQAALQSASDLGAIKTLMATLQVTAAGLSGPKK